MFAQYIVGGRLDPPFHPTKPSSNFIGRTINIPAKQNGVRVIKDTFHFSNDLEFYAISIRASNADPKDYWNLTIGGKTIAKRIYCKSYEEGLYLQVAFPVAASTAFTFEYHTTLGKSNTLDIMFHLLTDEHVNLVLTGTTDLGSYPDPHPETPEHPEPVGGEIQLPVTWQPFTSVAAAEEWARNLGIETNFARKLDAANYVTEALAMLLNQCGEFASMIKRFPLTVNIKSGRGANGYFNSSTGEVVISNTYDFTNAATITQAEYEAGQKSSPFRLRTIMHEMGHWLHFQNVGEADFYRIAMLDPDNYGAQTILSNREASYIANNLSNYATQWFPIELIAETFSAKMTGVPVDPRIWEWYEQYGGYKCSGW
ncbi:hypothetical protein ABEW34_17045 [Paenibacillus algorifonticola]|uniref:hypothetical protein n=1 Tax=Paenibacillus algorifonticola TaxID=684063 RepID=UPI003D2D4E86